MTRNKIILILTLIFRFIVGFVFIYAAIGKIIDPNIFAKEIMNYRIFGDVLSRIIAIFLPWVELIIGLFLIFGCRQKTVAFVSFFLLFFFTIIVISAMARGLNIDCGCFAQHIEYVGWKKVTENLVLLFLTIFIYFFPSRYLSLESYITSIVNE